MRSAPFLRTIPLEVFILTLSSVTPSVHTPLDRAGGGRIRWDVKSSSLSHSSPSLTILPLSLDLSHIAIPPVP